MYDLVIRKGTVVDGTGTAPRVADVAVQDGVIAAVGKDVGRGKQEVAAEGLLVTPGFVDIHTHYDGQATWDAYLTPSGWHGVTTAVFGNCSVGFAPVRPGSTDYLINLMEGVEDIPEVVLAEGVSFDWESYPQYLDALAAKPRVMDVGSQMPHAALRFYVMGERGANHAEFPTEDEIARMGLLLEEALHAGALGFTTSRTTKHRAADGRPIPSLSAREAELLGLARAMKRAGKGVIEVNSDFGPGEFEALITAAEVSARPLSCLLVQVNNAPGLWRQTLDQVREARAVGFRANAQTGCRPIGVMVGLESSRNPFEQHPAWIEMRRLTPKQRYERLKADPDLRRKLVEEREDTENNRWYDFVMTRLFKLGEPLNYEPDVNASAAAVAKARGVDPWAVALEWMMEDEGKALLLHPFENYHGGDLEVVREMLTDDATVMGVADGGAHVGLICDAGAPTYLLSHWARDRTRGPKLPLEFLVKKHTCDTAEAYGLTDRGVLVPGLKADLNVIDFDALRLLKPEIVYDLPAGGKRIIQKAKGYRHTFVAGVETARDGEFTGALPGRLVRGAR